MQKQLDRMEAKVEKALVGSKPAVCGNEKCFASHQKCPKCGEPRSGAFSKIAPPKAAASAPPKVVATAAVPQTPPGLQEIEENAAVADVPLEEQISTVEADVKMHKGARTPLMKAKLAGLEALLQELRDRQLKERPLPARLQAATRRLEKAAVAQLEATRRRPT